MTLTGSASVADYQAALTTIAYNNTSDDPSTLTRTVSFEINDGDLNSNILSRDIELVAANDCLLYTSPSPRDRQKSRMPSSA